MKRILIAGLLSLALVVPSGATLAGGYGHGGHGYKGGHHHGGGHYYRGGHGRRGHHHANGLLIGAGIIGGAILLGTLLSQPRHHQPAPAYHRPVNCNRDEVWQRLPDGRIQTGVRTRCY